MNALLKPNRERLSGEAFASLRDELSDALLNEPGRVVRTPGFKDEEYPGAGDWSAARVILDSFSDTTGDQSLLDLLGIVGAAARGEDVRLRAKLWISVRAAEFANYHCNDLVREIEEAE